MHWAPLACPVPSIMEVLRAPLLNDLDNHEGRVISLSHKQQPRLQGIKWCASDHTARKTPGWTPRLLTPPASTLPQKWLSATLLQEEAGIHPGVPPVKSCTNP